MESTEFTFYCDDRGAHRRRELGPLVDNRALNRDVSSLLSRFGFTDVGERPAGPDLDVRPARRVWHEGERDSRSRADSVRLVPVKSGGRVWELKCPTCGRTTRVPEGRLLAVAEAAESSGDTSLLNVSLWPS